MSARTSVLVLALFLSSAWGSILYKYIDTDQQLEEAEYPKSFKELKTLKEFVSLVEEHNLNVSVITSAAKNYEDGNVKEALTLTITFPTNEVSIDKATLTKESFKKLVDVANQEKLTVAATRANNHKLHLVSNNLKGVPINKAYKIFTELKNGKTGFVFDEENYVAQYTFLTKGADDITTTTKVFHGDVDVEVVAQSETVKDEEIPIIKKAIVDALFTFDESLVPKGIYAILGKTLPGRNFDVAYDIGDNYYIDSNYWIQVKVLNQNFLIYTP